ncbi:MAG: PIG-L family deacetylase [Candidatus Bathyarchaeia archaeon]
MKSLIVFAPHPDDETLGCGGTIVKKIREGYEVFVVYMTDGRYALTEVGENKILDPLDMKEQRRKDALKAAEILGLKEKNLCFLDIEDKTLKRHKQYAQKIVFEIMKNIKPSEIFFPQEKEYNLDHQMTHVIVEVVCERLKVNPIKYQYSIAWMFPFYLLNHLTNEGIFDFIMCRYLKCNMVRVDISKFLPVKEMAIKAYRSQRLLLSNKQKQPALKASFISRFLRNYEKFFVKRPYCEYADRG